jgi:hypothetical protein
VDRGMWIGGVMVESQKAESQSQIVEEMWKCEFGLLCAPNLISEHWFLGLVGVREKLNILRSLVILYESGDMKFME